MKTIGLKLIAGVMAAVILMTPPAFSYDSNAMDPSAGGVETVPPSKPAIGAQAPKEGMRHDDPVNGIAVNGSLVAPPTLTPVTPGDLVPDTGINDGTSDGHNSMTNDDMKRMSEAVKLTEKLNKWQEYLNKINAELARLEIMEAERSRIFENSKEVDQRLVDLFAAMQNAPSSEGMPSISMAEYHEYVARRGFITEAIDEAAERAKQAIKDAITELKREKANAEEVIGKIQNEIQQIMDLASSSAATFYPDPPFDYFKVILNEIIKADESMKKLKFQWDHLKVLGRVVLRRVNAIVAFYRRKGIALNPNEQAVVDAADKLREALRLV